MNETKSETERLLDGVSMGDPESIAQVAAKLDAADPANARAREIADSFRAANKDLFDDPYLTRLVYAEDEKWRELRPHMPLAERFELAGREVRKWLGEQMGGTRAPEQKRGTPARTVAGRVATQHQRASEPTEDDDAAVDFDARDIHAKAIAEMAATRGKRPIFHGLLESDISPYGEE